MVHPIRGLSAPISNANIEGIYCEVTLTSADVETYMSPIGGSEPLFPSDDGEIIELVSSNLGDVGTLRVSGLDEDFLFIEEDIELQGITPVQTTTEFTRINGISWREPTAFVGTLQAQEIGGAKVYRSANPETQISVDGVVSIAANQKSQLEQIYASIVRDSNSQSVGAISLYYRPIGFAFRRPFRFSVATRGNSSSTYENILPTEIEGPIDVYLTALGSDTGIEVVARLSIKLRQ